MSMNYKDASNIMHEMISEVGRDLVGDDMPRILMIGSLAAGENIMFGGIPGTGKTLLAKRLAQVAGVTFGRIQGVADLTPADIIGSSIPNITGGDSRIELGPIHNEIILFDELNRASTKSQSAVNSAMGEKHVTIGKAQFELNGDKPFMVVATQNEHDFGKGTFPVSDALYDRFGAYYHFEKSSNPETKQMLKNTSKGIVPEKTVMSQVSHREEIMAIQALLATVTLEDQAIEEIVEYRNKAERQFGLERTSDKRGPISHANLAKAMALLDGRNHVKPEDVKALAPLVLAHRMDSQTEDMTIPDKQKAIRSIPYQQTQ